MDCGRRNTHFLDMQRSRGARAIWSEVALPSSLELRRLGGSECKDSSRGRYGSRIFSESEREQQFIISDVFLSSTHRIFVIPLHLSVSAPHDSKAVSKINSHLNKFLTFFAFNIWQKSMIAMFV